MIARRPSEERGHADHGWLDTHHTFSFAYYHHPDHMGFGPLRVSNDDTVGPGGGFPPHPHKDMEIISYVLEGALQHKDNMGNGSVMRPGDVQRMSAGKGVVHSEFNASKDEAVHFLQIWIMPSAAGLSSGYEQKHFSADEKRGRLRLVASPDGADGSVRIQQDARLYATLIDKGAEVTHRFAKGRLGWVHLARGYAWLGDTSLKAGDGVAIEAEHEIHLRSDSTAEVLLFDLPA